MGRAGLQHWTLDSNLAAMACTHGHPAAAHLLLHCSWVWQDGLRHGVPTSHSAVLCFMVGPLGLLTHLLTRAIWHATGRGGRSGDDNYVVYRF